MSDKITPFLMFEGKAEEAINFYVSLFDDAEIINISHYGADEAGTEGTVEQALFTLNGRKYMATDSTVSHDFTFTPSISLFVQCDTERELKELFKILSENGQVLMPLDDYGFSTKFSWLNDRYGVSWQLNLK